MMMMSNDEDLAVILSKLPVTGADDQVARVLEIYGRIMAVSEPAERAYRTALQEDLPVNGFSTSANS
jgi:hypothetical protein